MLHNISTLQALHYKGLMIQEVKGKILEWRGPPCPATECRDIAKRVQAAEELPLSVAVEGMILRAYP